MPRLTQVGLIVAIFGGLLALAPPLADAYLLTKLLALAAGGTLAWLGLFGAPLRRTPLDGPLGALWAVMLVSSVASADPTMSVFGFYPQSFYGLVPMALYTSLYYAAANVEEAGTDRVLGWMWAASVPLALYGISQRFTGDLLTNIPLPSGHRILSTIGSPVMLGACLVVLLPISLHRALKKKSPLGLAAGTALCTALLLTWARGAWLGAAVSVAVYLWLTGRLRPKRKHALALVLLAPLLFFALQRGLKKTDSDLQRVEMLKISARAVAAHPLLGYGPDAFVLALRRHKTDEFLRLTHAYHIVQSSAHNDLIQTAVTLGLPGLLAYAWLLWALGARLYRRLKDSPRDGEAAALASALLGLFLQAKFNPIPASAMALAALMAGLACRGGKTLSPVASRAVSSLAAVFCAACVLLFARFCAADLMFRRGQKIVNTAALTDPSFMLGVNDLRRATELNPWLIDYLSQRCDTIFRVSAFVSPEQGRQLIEKSLALTAEGIRLHPANPMAHELRATALALASRFGAKTLPEALREIKTASKLDPTFVFSLRRRLEISRAVGDKEEFDRAQADYLRVITLTHDSAEWPRIL